MCFNVSVLERKAKQFAERYKDVVLTPWKDEMPGIQIPLFYFVNGFSHPLLPIVKHDGMFLYQWGVIPFWVKDDLGAAQMQARTLNAMSETSFEKPSFRKAIVSQRCLIPVNGFFEWRSVNEKKYPYYIHSTTQEIMSLGGIYESWVDKSSGEIRNTFSILTTAANPLLEKIHNLKKRMPLILSSENEREWVDPLLPKKRIEELMLPFPDKDLTAYTISKDAGNSRKNRNVPSIFDPVDYPEIATSRNGS